LLARRVDYYGANKKFETYSIEKIGLTYLLLKPIIAVVALHFWLGPKTKQKTQGCEEKV